MAYGHFALDWPRQFVMVGTTNAEFYLKDGTGNRRFWPVRTGVIDLEGLVRDRDQLWAEASRREAEGESIRLDQTLWAKAAEQQEARQVEDPWAAELSAALGDTKGMLLSDAPLVLLGVPVAMRTMEQAQRVGAVMRKPLGWKKTKRRFFPGADPVAVWVKGHGPKWEVYAAAPYGRPGLRKVGEADDEEGEDPQLRLGLHADGAPP
jgi:predicted P-loop ATPase